MEAHRKQSPKCVCRHSVNHHVAYNTVIPRHPPPLLCAHHSQPPSSLSAGLSASCFVCTVSGTGEERVGHENKATQGWQQVSFASAGAPIRRTQAHAHGTTGGAATWRHAAECSRGNSSRGFGAGVRMMRAVRGRVQIPRALAPLPGLAHSPLESPHTTKRQQLQRANRHHTDRDTRAQTRTCPKSTRISAVFFFPRSPYTSQAPKKEKKEPA